MFTTNVPALGVEDGDIGNLKVLCEVFHFHRSPPWLESLAGRFLAVPIPSHINPLVAHAEGSFSELSAGDSDVLRRQIGSGGRGMRHAVAALELGSSLAVFEVIIESESINRHQSRNQKRTAEKKS